MLKLHRRRLPNELIDSLRRTDMLIYLNLFLRYLRVYPLSPIRHYRRQNRQSRQNPPRQNRPLLPFQQRHH